MALISARSLSRPQEKQSAESRGVALLAKGFRPFFLLAGIFASLSIPLWLAVLEGRLEMGAYAGAISWHAHEMVFGFAAAVIAGFLLTAVSNWTGRETTTGGSLFTLVVLWLLGRAAMMGAAVLPPALVAILDVAFLPALAVTLAVPVLAAKNRRNYPVIGLVVLLATGNIFFHWSTLVGATELGLRSLLVMVDAIVLLVSVIGGRVIPFFTRNATRLESIRSLPTADRVAIASLVLVVCAEAAAVPALLSALLAFAGITSAIRMWHWGSRHAGKEALLWVLHVGYAWVPIGLLLRAWTMTSGANPFPALHALTVGAIGTLTLGMMSRVALGHTGRLLRAPSSAVAAFVLVTLSAVVRVVVPLIAPAASFSALTISALLWAAAFALFVFGYAAILVKPRADGKAG